MSSVGNEIWEKGLLIHIFDLRSDIGSDITRSTFFLNNQII